ncbi:MAG: hypothetical protein EXS63_09385 [Candidatus Omnitrophica bacterium]|nr:hypothetical protein [Candidatus Omnitrophota bacterium]
MKSHTTQSFRRAFSQLTAPIQKQAKVAYKSFQKDPYHPGLHFKRIHSVRPIYSVRISKDYRAVCIQSNDEFIWYWIGSHADYDRRIKKL